MSETNMTREEIEQLWIEVSTDIMFGKPLCDFMYLVGNSDLEGQWNKIWGNQNYTYISDYFDDDYYWLSLINSEDYYTLSYLLRALSLNILLDDMEVK